MSESRREDLTTDILRDIRRAKAGTRILQGMRRQYLRRVAAAALLSVVMSGGGAQAQKSGGILRVYHRDSPASMSIHEEGTNSVAIPMMAVFNNLVLYDQHQAQNSLDTIVPDLAESWSWNEEGTRLTFKLRQGVKWYDGKPFTSGDVKCTWDLLTGRAAERLRLNPRKSWWNNVAEIAAPSPAEATFVLKRPQPAILALIASGYTPIYPCHVSPRDMRQHPIGTGPFKFVAGKFDLTFPYELTVPLMKDVKSQAPQAVCEITSTNGSVNLLVNREAPPFDNPELRRALALALDRKSFIDILAEGQGDIGGAMLPPPAGVWGMPPDLLATVPGYAPDVAKNRGAAREIMSKLGYGPDKRLSIKVAARNIPNYRDPAIILIDQLKDIWIDGELDPIETANWFPKLARKDYQIGLNNTSSGVDDPDQQFFENYGCGSERNYTDYCNPELEKLFVEQSMLADREKRRRLVWEIDKKLQEDGARPIVYHTRSATCMQPQVKGLTIMVNSQYNGWRMEDVWLER